MRLVAVGVDEETLAAASPYGEVATSPVRDVEPNLEGAEALLVDARNVESDLERVLEVAEYADVPTAVIFSEITTEVLDEVVLRWQCIDLPIDARTLPAGIGSVLFDRPDVRGEKEESLEIGASFPMPTDPDEYERRRGVSLVSPRMRHFIRGLRLSLRQMRRPSGRAPLAPPWDPGNAQLDALDLQRSDEAHYRFSLKRGTTYPNLVDVLASHRDPDTRERFLKNLPPGRHAAADDGWTPLPPRLLILGESGTGKSLVADLVHRHLTAPSASLVTVNCGGLDRTNFDHEMFGAAPGSWTQIGTFEGAFARAAYGTAFLDEIGDMPLATQSRLLTFLTDLMIRPAGMSPFFGFTHIIAATNRNVDLQVATGRFRHDLLARFGMRVVLPPLRDRGSAELRHLIDFTAQNPTANPVGFGGARAVSRIDPDAMTLLMSHDYRDGNFRELEEVVSQGLRSAMVERSDSLKPHHLDMRTRHRPDIEERVVQVSNMDVGAEVDRIIEIDHPEEMRRLADQLGRPILAEEGGRMAILDGAFVYLCEGGGK